MSELDVRALEANFEGWRKERTPQASQSDAFERYTIEQILKDADLSDEEIESGIISGGDDGGVDAVYFFINRILIQDETDVPDPALTAQLIIIQSKYEKSFSEDAVEKMHAFTRDLLNYSAPVDSLTYLNSSAKEAISRFREKYNSILGSPHALSIDFHYAAKSDYAPNSKVAKRVENLKAFVKNIISAANVQFEFWDCARTLASARSFPKSQLSLEITKSFSTDDGAVVCLAKLQSFAQFLADDHGSIRRSILEPNVRDYQGKRNPVNADIRKTLGSAKDKEFWWLNNGITILARTNPSVVGNKLIVEAPEVVNGLQTSQEIFDFFKANTDKQDARTVLVRVLVPPDEQARTRITKATNFQTSVEPVSLRATDQIHFDIEERFRLYDLFYDRKKGKYRNQRKPIGQIISIRALAQAVIAVVLQQPNDARARPQSLLNKDEKYKRIFDNSYNRDVYVVCVHLDRQVEQFLEKQPELTHEDRRDIRYYVGMWISCELAQRAHPQPNDIAGLAQACLAGIPADRLGEAKTSVLSAYKQMGGTDKVAKGPELGKSLLASLGAKFPATAQPALAVKG